MGSNSRDPGPPGSFGPNQATKGSGRLEEGLLFNIGGQRCKHPVHVVLLHLLLFIPGEHGVATGGNQGLAGDNPVAARHLGHSGQVCDMDDGNAGPVNLFYDRCAATCAAPSRTHQEGGLNLFVTQKLGNAPAHVTGVFSGGQVAGGNHHIVVNTGQLPLLHSFPEGGQG